MKICTGDELNQILELAKNFIQACKCVLLIALPLKGSQKTRSHLGFLLFILFWVDVKRVGN